jgi:O-antigen/teichoic acid export membrane protein
MVIVCVIALHMYIQKTCHLFLAPQESSLKMPIYLAHGLPFLPSVLFALLLASSDRWILAHYASMHDVGIYALANTFVQLFQLLILQPMTISYIPHTLSNFVAQKNNIIVLEKNNRMAMYLSMLGLALVITIGFLFSKSLLYVLLPRAYHEAIGYIWFLLISYIFLFGTYFSTILIQYLQKRLFMSCVFIGPALFNIVLNLFLVPYYGISGCVVATFISYVSYFSLTLWYSNYLIKKVDKASPVSFY